MAEIADNRTARRFEMVENGATVFADYRRDGTRLVLPHVEAAPSLRGTGAAGRLMDALVVHARHNGLTLTPTCSYAAAWFRRHPEAHDVLS